MKKIITTLVVIISLITMVGCGGDTASPDTPSTIPVAIEGVNGQSGVAVNSVFDYTFSSAPNSATVTSDTLYIYPTLGGEGAKLAAQISSESDVVYRLSPSALLLEGMSYTIKVKLSSITDADGNPFASEDEVYIFSTEGASSTELSITSVVDGSYDAIRSTGSTDVYPTTFIISFSEDIEDPSNDIAFTCELPAGSSLEQPTISTNLLDAAVEITVEDAYKYQLLNCTLALGTNIISTDGISLAEAAEYDFTNACAMNDDFNTESKECWSIASEGDLNSWVLFDEVLTFDEANSTLDYDSSSAGTGVIYKEISIDELSESSSFELVFHLKSVGDTFVTDDAVVAAISGSISWAGFMTEPAIEFIVSTRSGFNPSCQYNYWASGMGAGQTGTGSYDCSAIASDIYFKAIGDSSGVTFQVSPDGTNYENFTSTTGSLPASAFELFSLFDEFYTLLWFGNNSGVNLTTNIDSIVLTGFSATGQY